MGKAKTRILNLAKRAGLFHFTAKPQDGAIPILCYHGLWTVDDDFHGDAMFMRAETFSERLDQIQALGFEVISLDKATSALATGNHAGPDKPIVITIDDGWHTTWSIMMPELRKRNMHATLYCDSAHMQRGGPVPHVMARYARKLAGNLKHSETAETTFAAAIDLTRSCEARLASVHDYAEAIDFDLTPYLDARTFTYMTPENLREFHESGLDVQLHTHNHTMHDLSTDALRKELDLNKAALAELTGKRETDFNHFCYPSGVCEQPIADWLQKAGYTSTTTTLAGLATTKDHPHLLKRLIDGNNLSPIEFEAEISGVGDKLRAISGRTQNIN